MIEALTKAARIASDKNGLPILSAVLVDKGTITASNGAVSIVVPCPALAGHGFAVEAVRFLAAVKACDGEPKIKITDSGKLSVTRGKFRALLPLMDAENYPVPDIMDKGAPCPANFIDRLKLLKPFIATDKSRPWATGLKIDAKLSTMCVTNGTVLIRAELPGWKEKDIVLPLVTCDALCALDAALDTVVVSGNNVTFIWPDGTRLIAALLSHSWPDVDKLLTDIGKQEAVPEGLADAIARILPFCPDKDFQIIRLTKKGDVCTAEGDSSCSQGGFSFKNDSAFQGAALLSVLNLATSIDFSKYPAAVPFTGAGVNGVLAGSIL